MRKLFQTAILGASLLIIPFQTCSPQDAGKGIPIRTNRMSKEEAENKLNFIQFRLSRFPSFENPTEDYHEIKEELLELLKKSDDRGIKYNANFLMAKLVFENKSGTFSEAFSLLERCVFEYSDKEKEHGLVYGALSSISDRFAKEKRLIGTSRTYELAQLSPYLKKDLRHLKRNLDDILDTEVGGLHLKESLKRIFSPDRVEGHASFRMHENKYIAPVPEWYGAALSGPETKLEEVTISSTAKISPRMYIKNVNLVEENETDKPESLFSYHKRRISLSFNSLDVIRNNTGIGNATNFSQKEAKKLNSLGVVVREMDIYNYITGHNRYKKVDGYVYHIVVRKGVTIRDFFENSEVNPYNWFYKNVQKIKW